MRELKFRCWCKNKREWESDPVYLTLYGRVCHGVHLHGVKPDTHIVQQFIGVKDTNGRDIYEGDIIELADGGRGVVGFKDGYFYHTAKTEIIGVLYWNKVVGNIFENPELLTKEGRHGTG